MTLIDIYLRYLSVDEILLLQITKYKNSALSDSEFYELLKNDYPEIYSKIETMRNDLKWKITKLLRH